jgi:hypothetical protein
MMKLDEIVVMRAIAICFKPYLKPEEAMIYCNLSRTQFARKCEDYGIFKSSSGYYKKEDLDLMCSGGPSKYELNAQSILASARRRKHR